MDPNQSVLRKSYYIQPPNQYKVICDHELLFSHLFAGRTVLHSNVVCPLRTTSRLSSIFLLRSSPDHIQLHWAGCPGPLLTKRLDDGPGGDGPHPLLDYPPVSYGRIIILSSPGG